MFINCTNHRVENWGEGQRQAAGQWGEIIDYPFPMVSPLLKEEEIEALAEHIVQDILLKQPDIVMCQGEFTLTYAIVNRLKLLGVKVVAACSERKTEELLLPDGGSKRESYYEFVRFREYV